MTKRDYFGLILTLLIIAAIVAAFLAVKTLRQEGSKCIVNPMQYGVDAFALANKQNIQCTCTNLDKYELPLTYTSNLSKK